MRTKFIAVWIMILYIIFSVGVLCITLDTGVLKFFLKYQSIFYFFGLLMLIVPIIISLLVIPKERKSEDKILIEDIPDEFEEIYKELYNNHIDVLESMRKKVKLLTVIGIISFGIFFISHFISDELDTIISRNVDAFFEFLTLPSLLMGIVLMCINYKKLKQYAKAYKKEIISRFIELVNNKLVYKGEDFEKGKIQYEYKNAEFDNSRYNRFLADDYIEGPLDYWIFTKMADIGVMYDTDEDTKIRFLGIFALTTGNKDIRTCIKILNKSIKSENRVEMDSEEFEKYFNVYAENKILTMRILTPDIMEYLTDFRNKFKMNYEIVFRDSTIYFRFFTGDMFEPKVFGSSMDKELLLTYYNIFNFIVEITKKINDVLQEIEL